MYSITETRKPYNKPFNEKYTLVFSNWGVKTEFGCNGPIYMKLRNNETDKYLDLPMNIQHLLNPLYIDTIRHTYFITAKEDIQIKLAINLIKAMINF